MTTDTATTQGLWLIGVGTDTKIYCKYNTSGQLDKAEWTSWEKQSRYEPFLLPYTDGNFDLFNIDAYTGNLWTHWGSMKSPPKGSDNWANLGGVLEGSPVAVEHNESKGYKNVYAVGMDGNWWECNFQGSKWEWNKLPVDAAHTPFFQADKINASTDGNNIIDLVGVAVTNDIYHRRYNGRMWTGWTSIGKNLGASRPLCFTMSATRCDIVAQASNGHHLWHTALDNCSWQGWEQIGDQQMAFDPAGCYYVDKRNERFDVLAVGVNGKLYHQWNNTKDGGLGKWRYSANTTQWEEHDCFATATPKIATRKGDIVDFFHRGGNSAYYWKYWNGKGSFVGWNSVGGTLIRGPR